ncbi:hypothetical protein DFQ28_007083 [Apophysomyces sp. BC1034]|nr:hypothetical protein DFQ28_007083 [Apophysomyces sp. BC1034]
MLATTTKTKRRMALAATFGGITLISAVFGPIVWVTVLGVGSVVTWRTWSKTQKIWQTLSPQASTASSVATNILGVLKSQVKEHHLTDGIRQDAIDHLLAWADTDDGRRVLVDEFNVDHVKQLTFLPVHAMTTVERGNSRKVNLEFWVEDDQSVGNRGGACIVRAIANVNKDGQVQLEDIRLSAPGWHADEVIPLKKSVPDKVIEGEFLDV